ncbi:MAG: GNAT family N-acetyltransferase [Clostridia bacterium]|nr:GNAT family N-acetyltransferase [Clostridia bacterium]
MNIGEYTQNDLNKMLEIWNKVVEDGIAFPQEELLNTDTGAHFFAAQSYCGVAKDDGNIVGLYILHPNNVGRCGHICNASFAVDAACRGRHIGEKLVLDCLKNAKRLGFKILQFNAVVESNIHARHLYERLGFTPLGMIPRGFRMKDGHFENICPYYIDLEKVNEIR